MNETAYGTILNVYSTRRTVLGVRYPQAESRAPTQSRSTVHFRVQIEAIEGSLQSPSERV